MKNSKKNRKTVKAMTTTMTTDLGERSLNKQHNNRTIVIPKMKEYKMKDLASKISKNHKIIGVRFGEKLDEVLISKHETPNAYKYGKQYYLITTNPNDKLKFQQPLNKTLEEYNSHQNLMSKREIRELLKRGGYLE